MRKTYFFLFFILTINNFYAQNRIEGVVTEKDSNKKIAFAHVYYNQQKNKGVTTDIDGKFNLSSNEPISSIHISCLGYEYVEILGPFDKQILVNMMPKDENLDEIVIKYSKKENPALAIIQQVIANRDKNNPLKKGGFKYQSYNKTVFINDSIGKNQASTNRKPTEKKDTILSRHEQIMKDGKMYLILMESVTERTFLPPGHSNEQVIATKVSGFSNPYFVSLATELQPFGFYEEYIKILDIHFLNPISKNALNHYDFYLEDTLTEDNHQVYLISYQPKSNKKFDGLKGFLYVHTNGYAIKNVVAEPAEKMKMHLKIQQLYTQIENNWFPNQLNYDMSFDLGLKVDGRTYISEVSFLTDLKPKDFSIVQLSYDKEAPKKEEGFWEKYRTEPLTIKDLNTYEVIDSLGKKHKFDKFLDVGSKLMAGNLSYKFLDFPIERFIDYNQFEGLRLGSGLYTNEKFLKNFRIGGYFAYGFKDKFWKYSADFQIDLNKEKEFYFTSSYSYDVREIGTQGLKRDNNNIFSDLRSFMASEMDLIKRIDLSIHSRLFKYLSMKITFANDEVYPYYSSTFESVSDFYKPYRISSIQAHFRYAYLEKIQDNVYSRISLGTKYPVFQLNYTRGLKDVWVSDFSFNKIEAKISHEFYTNRLGKTKYTIQGGIIDKALPTGLFFTGEGSRSADLPYVVAETFQTMLPYEFISDRYLHLFLKHDIGSLLFKTKKFSPGVIIHHNMAWGDLVRKPFILPTKNKVFMESGLELTKLITTNYIDVAYLGLGAGVFYRHQPYQLEINKDNFVFKFNMTLTFN